MTKNYFTDEQLNAIHKEICRLEDLESGTSLPVHPLNNVETANLRRICNLAVEAAIGEPIGAINTESNSICRWHFHFSHEDYVHRFNPLYSVKELEN